MKIQRIAFLSVALSLASVAGQAKAFDPHCLMRHLGFGWSDGYHAQPCCNPYGKTRCARHLTPTQPYHGVAVQSAPANVMPFPHSFAIESGGAYSPGNVQGPPIQRPNVQMEVIQQRMKPGPAVQQPINHGPLPESIQPPMNQPAKGQPAPGQQSRFMPMPTNRQAMNAPSVFQPGPIRHPQSVIIQEPQNAPRTSAPMMTPSASMPMPTNGNFQPQPNYNAANWRQWQPTGR